MATIRAHYTIETLTRRPGAADFAIEVTYSCAHHALGTLTLAGTWYQRDASLVLDPATRATIRGPLGMADEDAEVGFLADWLREADEGDTTAESFDDGDEDDEDDADE